MSDRLDWYFKQKVTEAELDLAFTQLETADLARMQDMGMQGVLTGLIMTQQAMPNLTLACSLGAAYDKLGRRLSVPTNQNVDLSKDFTNVSTAVTTNGNARWISVFLVYERVLTDPRLDGNSVTVFFQRAEGYRFKIVMSAESPSPSRPALDNEGVLLVDALRTFGQTTFVAAGLDSSRREDAFVTTGTPRALRAGRVSTALAAIMGFYNAHVTGAADPHPATAVNYGGGANWANGTPNPAATVEDALDAIIIQLANTFLTISGARKIGIEGATAGAYSWTAGTLFNALTSLLGQVNTLDGQVGKKAIPNTWTASQTISADLVQLRANQDFEGVTFTETTTPDYQLLFYVLPAASAPVAVYHSVVDRGFRLTSNAYYDQGGWRRSIAATVPMMLDITATGIFHRRYSTGSDNSQIDLAAHLTGELLLSAPQSGTAGAAVSTRFNQQAVGIGPGSVTNRFTKKHYAGAAGETYYESSPFPKRFTLAPSSVTATGTVTNVTGALGGVTFTSDVAGARVQWTAAAAGSVSLDLNVTAV